MPKSIFHKIYGVLPSELFDIKPIVCNEMKLMCLVRDQFFFPYNISKSKLPLKAIYTTNWLCGNLYVALDDDMFTRQNLLVFKLTNEQIITTQKEFRKRYPDFFGSDYVDVIDPIDCREQTENAIKVIAEIRKNKGEKLNKQNEVEEPVDAVVVDSSTEIVQQEPKPVSVDVVPPKLGLSKQILSKRERSPATAVNNVIKRSSEAEKILSAIDSLVCNTLDFPKEQLTIEMQNKFELLSFVTHLEDHEIIQFMGMMTDDV